MNIIRYRIYIQEETKDGYVEWKAKEDYSTYEKAEAKVLKSYKRKNNKIITFPDEFTIGTKIYSGSKRIAGRKIPKQDNYLYGEIIDEDERYYYIKRSFAGEDDRFSFHKDMIEEKFIEGYWSIVEREDGSN